MFTGIVTDVGVVETTTRQPDLKLRIAASRPTIDRLERGASVACNGICLTVVECGTRWFSVEASGETEATTTVADWIEGTKINLERALRVGDELGGHIVSGHVDGVAIVTGATPAGASVKLDLHAPGKLAQFIAPKGSVTLDGVSLTVNDVSDTVFSVNVIPHTRGITTFGDIGIDQRLNLEIDMLARYLARMQEMAA